MPHKKGPKTPERRSAILRMQRAMARRPRTVRELHVISGIPQAATVAKELHRMAAAGLVRPCGTVENGKPGPKPFLWRLA